jgi:hypothetical protein
VAFFLDSYPHTRATMSAGTLPVVFVAAILLTAGAIAWCAVIIAGRHRLMTGALVASGVGSIAMGTALLASHATLVGAASIALGAAPIAIAVARIGPRTIVIRVQQIADWATKVPPKAENEGAGSETRKS